MGRYHSSCRPETARLRAIFIAPTKLKNHFPLPFNGGHSLSLAFARQLPQGGSREWVRTIHPTARKAEGCGRFSSPLRNSKTVSLYHSTDDTPSVSHSLDSSLREGAGNGLHHSSGYSLKSQVGGRFSSPLRKAFSVHRGTLSQRGQTAFGYIRIDWGGMK